MITSLWDGVHNKGVIIVSNLKITSESIMFCVNVVTRSAGAAAVKLIGLPLVKQVNSGYSKTAMSQKISTGLWRIQRTALNAKNQLRKTKDATIWPVVCVIMTSVGCVLELGRTTARKPEDITTATNMKIWRNQDRMILCRRTTSVKILRTNLENICFTLKDSITTSDRRSTPKNSSNPSRARLNFCIRSSSTRSMSWNS